MKNNTFVRVAIVSVLGFGASMVWAQNVKVTPLGSHVGELCDRDRATIFEDPTGVHILYDAGQSITGADDPRLGDVHVVLLSHAHGDHMGDRKMKALGAGKLAVAAIFFAEALLLALFGGLLGFGAGAFMARQIGNSIFNSQISISPALLPVMRRSMLTPAQEAR